MGQSTRLLLESIFTGSSDALELFLNITNELLVLLGLSKLLELFAEELKHKVVDAQQNGAQLPVSRQETSSMSSSRSKASSPFLCFITLL